MRAVLLLLGNDVRRLVRSPALAAALVLYPLLVALLVGLLVRYAGERPRVALVEEDALPSVLVVGGERFDIAGMLAGAGEVRLVRMPGDQADRELAAGKVLATLVVPEGFASRLRGMRESPQLVLQTTEDGLASRVVEKLRSLVYRLNRDLQRAYIDANLAAVRLLLRGGSGRIGETRFTLMGLRGAARELRALARSRDPAVAARARELAAFVSQLEGAVSGVGEFLRATAHPIELVRQARGGRAWALSTQVQAYALALALAFAATLLGAGALTAERDENVLGRITPRLVGLGRLVAEKVAFVTLVGGVLGLVLALAFGGILEAGSVAAAEPWRRFPLLALGLVLAAGAFGAFGALLGALARQGTTAILVAFLVALPVALVGLVPAGSVAAAGRVASAFPFTHAVRFFTAALADVDPAAALGREAAWLVGLAAAFALAARVAARRLVA